MKWEIDAHVEMSREMNEHQRFRRVGMQSSLSLRLNKDALLQFDRVWTL